MPDDRIARERRQFNALFAERLAIASSTSIHEAGHAVAHIRLSIQQAGVSIAPDGETAGRVTAEAADSAWDSARAADQALAYCAGYAALVAVGVDPDRASEGAGDDFANVDELIRLWGLEGGRGDWQARAVAMMREPRNVVAVALVAQWLERERALDGDMVAALVELADGDATPEDFDAYMGFRAAVAARTE